MVQPKNHGKTLTHDKLLFEVIYTVKRFSLNSISIGKLKRKCTFTLAFC